MPDADPLNTLLGRASAGEAEAVAELVAVVDEELHGLAGRFLRREGVGHTLQPTALVNEAWLRLFGQRNDYEGRQHFLAIAATVMRRVLADHARRGQADKRGGDWERTTWSGRDVAMDGPDLDVLALDVALDKLARLHERQARLVELRFFAGMTVEEAADELGVSRSTAEAEWRGARAWLRRELGGS